MGTLVTGVKSGVFQYLPRVILLCILHVPTATFWTFLAGPLHTEKATRFVRPPRSPVFQSSPLRTPLLYFDYWTYPLFVSRLARHFCLGRIQDATQCGTSQQLRRPSKHQVLALTSTLACETLALARDCHRNGLSHCHCDCHCDFPILWAPIVSAGFFFRSMAGDASLL